MEQPVLSAFGIHQLDLAFVNFGRLIKNLEDAVSAHRGIKHTVDLLTDAGNGARKTLVEREERYQCTKCHACVPVDNECCAQYAHEHIAQVTQVAVDGHDDVADAVGIVGIAAQFLVDDLKLLNGLILMAKDLNDLLASHHLFNEAVYLGQFLLLDAEMLA